MIWDYQHSRYHRLYIFTLGCMQTLIFLVLFWLISEIAGTIAWFGSSSIFLPLASQVLDFKNALILVAIYHIFGNASRLSFFYKHINKKILVVFWIPSIIMTVIWASLAHYVNQDLLKMMMGSVLFCFALYSLLAPQLPQVTSNIFWIIGWGLSGLTAGLVGTGGVLRGAFMSLYQLPKEQYIATIALVALIVDATRIPIYFKNGFLDTQLLYIIPILFITAFIGSFIGKKIVSSLSDAIFKKIIFIAIMILSCVFVYQWFMAFTYG